MKTLLEKAKLIYIKFNVIYFMAYTGLGKIYHSHETF